MNADQHMPDAVGILTGLWAERGLHRDVRIAVITAPRELLPDPRMWQLLEQAAGDPEIARAVLSVGPNQTAPPLRARYADLVSTVAGSADPELAAEGVSGLGSWSRYRPETIEVLIAAYGALGQTATWRPAMEALILTCGERADFEPLVRAVRSLAAGDARDTAGDLRRAADRDLPARQRVLAAVASLSARSAGSRIAANGGRQVAAALAENPNLRHAAARLAAAAVRWVDPDPMLWLAPVLEHADTPVRAQAAAGIVTGELASVIDQLDLAALLTTATTLAADSRPAGAELVLSVIQSCGPASGWHRGWTELLRALREHSAADTSERALGIFTSVE